MGRRIIDYILKLFLILLGISCIVSLPNLFTGASGIGFNPLQYLKSMSTAIFGMKDLNHATFFSNKGETPVFPYLFEGYTYSLAVLLGSFFAASLAAFLLTFLFYLAPLFVKKMIRYTFGLFSSIPDAVFVLLMQLFIITIYKTTGIKLLTIYALQQRVYVFPIICLAFVPAIILARIMIQIVEDELIEEYILFAKAKGISKTRIFFIHIFRNIFPSLRQHIGVIYWTLLSGLIMIEYLFQMKGITTLLIYGIGDSLYMAAILLLFLPFAVIRLLTFFI